MTGTELLKSAIQKGELHYYKQTGSFAYVAEYEDGFLAIVYNALSAEAARPDVPFKIVAEARHYDGLGNPHWVVLDLVADEEEIIFVREEENNRFYIDEPIITTQGDSLDRGFILDTSLEVIEWTEPQGGETRVFDIQECRYLDGTPVSLEDGELIGEPENEYLARK